MHQMHPAFIFNLNKAIREHKQLTEHYGPPGLVMLNENGYIADGEIYLDDYLIKTLHEAMLSQIDEKTSPDVYEMLKAEGIAEYHQMKVNRLELGWELKPLPGIAFV